MFSPIYARELCGIAFHKKPERRPLMEPKKRRIVIAPDSFKGSISAKDAAEAISRGIVSVLPDAEVLCFPVADGGEGTLEAITAPCDRYRLTVTGPEWKKVGAEWGSSGDCAVVEMAKAAGITYTGEGRRAATATTFGVGELIRDVLAHGFRKIMLTAGGSATNDGGCGMFSALGAVFRDKEGNPFVPTGGTIGKIESIDLSGLDPALPECEITVAADITNPLLGKEGATYVYGPQKGATAEELAAMEAGMKKYARLLEAACGRDVANVPGCGAAGGLSAPLIAFCGAKIMRGIDTVLGMTGFRAALDGASAVITGEGKIDRQSLYGKAVSGVAGAAAKAGVPVDVISGTVGQDREELLTIGLRSIRTITDIEPDSRLAIENAAYYLEKLGADWASSFAASRDE